MDRNRSPPDDRQTMPTYRDDVSAWDRQIAATLRFAEVLRESPYVQDWSAKDAIAELKPALKQDDWGYRQELLQLMKSAVALNK